MSVTPLRSIRISDEVWQAAQEKALAEGQSVTDIIRTALIDYAENPLSTQGA